MEKRSTLWDFSLRYPSFFRLNYRFFSQAQVKPFGYSTPHEPFSISSHYNLISARGKINLIAKYILGISAISNVILLMWLLFGKAIIKQDNLQKYDWIGPRICCLRNSEEENIQCIFVMCIFAKQIRSFCSLSGSSLLNLRRMTSGDLWVAFTKDIHVSSVLCYGQFDLSAVNVFSITNCIHLYLFISVLMIFFIFGKRHTIWRLDPYSSCIEAQGSSQMHHSLSLSEF